MNLRAALGMAPRASFDDCEPTKRFKLDQQDTTSVETSTETPTLTKIPSESGSDRYNVDTNETSKPSSVMIADTSDEEGACLRRRDRKRQEKQLGMEQCVACRLIVERTKRGGFCHICIKTLEQAERIAERNEGTVEYVEATRGFVCRCADEHVWNVPFKVKL